MKPTNKSIRAGAGLLAVAAALPAAALAAWTPRADLAVVQGQPCGDPASGAPSVEVRLVNRGDDALTGRLRIVVEGTSPAVVDADGRTDGGNRPYFDVALSGPGLAPGASTGSVCVGLQPDGRTRPQLTLRGEIDDAPFMLQLLHVSDIDSTSATEALANVKGFSALLDHFRRQYPGHSVTLSSGDNWIPGPRHSAAADDRLAALLGVPGDGRGDVALLNAMGFQASALGNHELDRGPSGFVSVVVPETADGSTWPGARFPYLSTNLDFTADPDTAPLVAADGWDVAAIANGIAGWATIAMAGETIGVVGATTPALGNITNTGGIGVRPAGTTDLDALAAAIQPAVDALTARGINKVILLAHMQQIAIEEALATRLTDVDIIVAGGSNTRLFDGDDLIRAGDARQGDYPTLFTSPQGEPVAVVNTDGDYKYLGRLVCRFSADGRLDPASLDPAVNGAYATNGRGLARLGLSTADADPAVAAMADRLRRVIAELDGNVLGYSRVYLDGRRGRARREETNLGDLVADANLWVARRRDPRVRVSIKNGGGIRAGIGRMSCPPGCAGAADVRYLPPDGGRVSRLDVQSSLPFNDGLTLLTLTAAELKAVIEHGVADSSPDPSNTPGRFPQVAGIRFSWDPALAPGSRVRSLDIIDDDGVVAEHIVAGGRLAGDPARTFRVVTLHFLADGGDGYPFPSTGRLDLAGDEAAPRTGLFRFAADGSEQDALAEYLGTFFAEMGYDRPETPAGEDPRNRNLGACRKDRSGC